MVRNVEDVEHGSVGSEARTHEAISKHLVPDELLEESESESLFLRLNLLKLVKVETDVTIIVSSLLVLVSLLPAVAHKVK